MSSDLELAERAARAAGEVLLSYYGRAPEGLESKTSATDPVSDADREAERVIRELLSTERPDDGTTSAAPACDGAGATNFVIKIWWSDDRTRTSGLPAATPQRFSTTFNP